MLRTHNSRVKTKNESRASSVPAPTMWNYLTSVIQTGLKTSKYSSARSAFFALAP